MDIGKLPRFTTIGYSERANILKSLKKELSGYLGGYPMAGYWCTKLEEDWKEAFGVKHAIPCNSATSGLLAACMAAGIGPGDTVWTTPTSMSATAACAKVLGAKIRFIDIETIRYSMNLRNFSLPYPKAIIVANIFGHPAYLSAMRAWCDTNDVIMIEDNAQSPFAMENGKYAGTVGHIGVFSLNVHKHIQCGEGGVIVTNDSTLGEALRGAINHGELCGLAAGLNLRMAEPIAAIACAQLKKALWIISGRIALAEEITDMFEGIPWVTPPRADVGCVHVYYVWMARVAPEKRAKFSLALRDKGLPFNEGYCRPLNLLFGSPGACHVAEQMHYRQFMSFEICAYTPKTQQMKKMRGIIRHAAASCD